MTPITHDFVMRHNARVAAGKAGKLHAANEGVERESDLHSAIVEHCRRAGWIPLHGSMASPTRRTEGEPDFVILADAGRVLFVECKSRTGKLSPAQVAFSAHAAHLGHAFHVVRSYAEFLDVIGGAR